MSSAIFFAEIFSVEMNEFISLILNKNINVGPISVFNTNYRLKSLSMFTCP